MTPYEIILQQFQAFNPYDHSVDVNYIVTRDASGNEVFGVQKIPTIIKRSAMPEVYYQVDKTLFSPNGEVVDA